MSIVIKNSGGRSALAARPTNTRGGGKKKSNVKSKPKRQRRVRQRKANRADLQLNLASCSVRYASAVLDPFNYAANELPCIPDSSDAPTFKGSVLAQGTFATGTTGFGFIAVAPQATGINDIPSIACTASNYTVSSVNCVSGTTGLTLSTMSRAPFAASTFPVGRLVALGLRIRYIDTELARGGRVGVATANDTNTSDDTFQGLTSDALFSRPNSQSKAVDRRWHTVALRQTNYAGDFGKYSSIFGFGQSGSASNAQLIAFVESSPSIKFEYAVIAYWEWKPSGVLNVPATTRSHVDPMGYAVVRDFLSQVQDSDVGTAAWQSFLAYAKRAAMSYIGVPAAATLGWK